MLEKLVKPIADVIRFHKGKLALVFFSALLFAVILFPYRDLSTLLTTTLAEKANVFVQFDDMSVGLIPPLTLSLDKAQIQSGRSPAIKADHLVISPSLSGLLTLSPGGSAEAKGLFGGNVSVSARNTESDPEAGINRWDYALDAQGVSISEATELATLPMQLEGSLNAKSSGEVDINFKDHPKAEYLITGKNIELAPFALEIPQFGPMNFPGFNWSDLHLEGRLVGGQLFIKDGRLGSPKDNLSLRVKGYINMQLKQNRGRVSPDFGSYELKLELNVTPAARREQIVNTLLNLIDQYKAGNGKYLMTVSGASLRSEPKMVRLSSFD